MIIDFIGWSASLLFGFCAVPQVYTCWKQGHGKGLSQILMWMWLLGEFCLLIYAIGKLNSDPPVLVNTTLNITFLLIIMRYIYYPRRTE